MFGLAFKMVFARKGRLVLTSLAVILGTAFLSGTYVFRDTINQTFDRLFADIFRDVDAYVRSTTFIELDFGGEQRATTPISALDTVRGVEGVSSATGDIQAFARVIGKDGEPLGSEGGGPPTFGGIASADSAGLWIVDSGRLPVGPNEVMLDRATADTGEFVVGDTVRVVSFAGPREFTLVGVASYGDIASPGGATFALFDQPTASEFLLQPGFVDAILVEGDGTVDDEALAARIDAALSPDLKLETLTGAEITAETQGQIKDVLNIFSTFLIVFSFIALGKTVGFTLTLAGVAGAIVSIGITADSFIIYYERIRDALREGKSMRQAAEVGWVATRRTILAADFVTLLAAIVLYIVSVGNVRGFAFTLGLITLIDILVAFLFTYPLTVLVCRSSWMQRTSWLTGLRRTDRAGAGKETEVPDDERTKAGVES